MLMNRKKEKSSKSRQNSIKIQSTVDSKKAGDNHMYVQESMEK
jgi:hypothetical protein